MVHNIFYATIFGLTGYTRHENATVSPIRINPGNFEIMNERPYLKGWEKSSCPPIGRQEPLDTKQMRLFSIFWQLQIVSSLGDSVRVGYFPNYAFFITVRNARYIF